MRKIHVNWLHLLNSGPMMAAEDDIMGETAVMRRCEEYFCRSLFREIQVIYSNTDACENGLLCSLL